MATSKVSVSEGIGKNLATFSFAEDSVTKEISRTALADSAGVDILGTKADAVWDGSAGSPSGMSLWKYIATKLAGALKVDHTTTGLGQGKKTVTTAGTDLAIATSTPAKWVTIQAYTTNTGKIAVGGAGVDATIATGDGVLLSAGESITVAVDNLSDVFVDATVSGEGVRFTYGT